MAARMICYETAASLDRAHRGDDAAMAKAAEERASLLTPVAKAFSTDIGNETTSLAVQVHGGMGYIEETGVAQLMRDARICAIYEGTNGIQAIDLVGRKLPMNGGAALKREIAEMRALARESHYAAVSEAVEALAQASDYLAAAMTSAPNQALAGATPYLRLFALARGATLLEKGAKSARRDGDPNAARYETLSHFFAKNIAVAAPGLAKMVMEGAQSVTEGSGMFSGVNALIRPSLTRGPPSPTRGRSGNVRPPYTLATPPAHPRSYAIRASSVAKARHRLSAPTRFQSNTGLPLR